MSYNCVLDFVLFFYTLLEALLLYCTFVLSTFVYIYLANIDGLCPTDEAFGRNSFFRDTLYDMVSAPLKFPD